MKKPISKFFWFVVLVVVAYVVLFYWRPAIADKVATTLHFPPEINQTLAKLKIFVNDAAETSSDYAKNLTLSGAKQTINDLNSKVQPLVEQAVGTAQQFLSGAAQVRKNVEGTINTTQAAIQEKRQQLDNVAQAAGKVVDDYGKLKDSVGAVVSKPTVFLSGVTATGSTATGTSK